MLRAKRCIAAVYDRALSGRADVRPMPRAEWAESACWLYSVLCATAADADNLVATFNESKIEARHFWEPLSRQEPYRHSPTYLSGVCAELGGRIVSLPCSTGISEEQQARVIARLAAWRGARLKDAA